MSWEAQEAKHGYHFAFVEPVVEGMSEPALLHDVREFGKGGGTD